MQMDGIRLTTIVSLILTLSIASERLVEVIKGFIPLLDTPSDDPKQENETKRVLADSRCRVRILTARKCT
jgi:hypothetical protein